MFPEASATPRAERHEALLLDGQFQGLCAQTSDCTTVLQTFRRWVYFTEAFVDLLLFGL